MQLLYSLVVVVDCGGQSSLGALLAYDELIEMVIEELGCDSGCAGQTATGEGTSSLLVRNILVRMGQVREGERSGASSSGQQSATADSTRRNSYEWLAGVAEDGEDGKVGATGMG